MVASSERPEPAPVHCRFVCSSGCLQDGREIDTSMSTLFLQDNAVDVGELQKGTCASISSSSPHTATDGPGLPSAEGAPAR